MKTDAGKKAPELKIVCRSSGQAPNYRVLAGDLLRACREFYQDPDNEKAFHEWQMSGKDRRAD